MIDAFKTKIETCLDSLIPSDAPYAPSLYEGARYSLLGPGKRMRPLLTLLTVQTVQKNDLDAAFLPACALEIVHTYSLIHDDLPCMDDDDFRRGRPTLHKVYTEGHAVLIGDYLLTLAFEVIATCPKLSPDQKLTLTQILAKASGGQGMIGGQVMDIENSLQLEEMHTKKTASLFCAAVEFGGIITQAPLNVMQMLKTFGLQFGQLFQLVDDILDEDHLHGEEKARSATLALYDQIRQTLDSLPYETTSLLELTDKVVSQISLSSLQSSK